MFKLKGRSEGTKSKEALRYRAYIWLMNLALLVTFAWILEIIVRRSTGIPGLGLTGTADFIAPGAPADYVVSMAWKYYMAAFVIILQFLRWWDSR